jgi:hypothetical protein
MRRRLSSLILILAMFLPYSVHAQDPLVLSSLQIGIWPEFDKPSVLVIYQMTLPSNTTYPVSVSVRIPISAGVPNAVAARQPDGSLLNIDYNRQVAGQWAIISFSTNAPEVQVEYYDPSLTKNADARHFTYTWPGDYAVSQLIIQVQEPSGVTDMRISPSLGAGEVGSDGLTYYTQDIGAVSAGQNFQITIDYQKKNDVLTAETLPVESSAPIPQGASTGIDLKTWLPWGLGILGATLIVGGIIWFWETGRQRPAPQARRRKVRSSSYKPEVGPSATEEAVYCSQCGKRAMPGDQFCRYCGSAIRSK